VMLQRESPDSEKADEEDQLWYQGQFHLDYASEA
jgi:hypothetical protein